VLRTTIGPALGALSLALTLVSAPIVARGAEQNCANEFRSGKLYFSQKIYLKAMQHYQLAVDLCPEKADYRAHYAISVAQFWGMRLDDALIPGADRGELAAVADSAESMYRLVGAEFDSSLALDTGKKNAKFVRENRKHFWVERYNLGLKLYKEKDYQGSALQFKLARLVDASDPKAYSQGAVALISTGDEMQAAELVRQGLALAPDDKSLHDLQESINLSAAQAATARSERNSSAASADTAITLLGEVLDARGGNDPNILFDRGVAYSDKAAAIAVPDSSGDVPPDLAAKAAEANKLAAADFGKAVELVPMEQDEKFHMGALFNQFQALVNAEDVDTALPLIKEYLEHDWKDPDAWQLLARSLIQKKSENEGVAALMAAKSLSPAGGKQLSLDDAIKHAEGKSADALTELGNPAAVYTYQEQQSGNQIECWFWPDKKVLRCFILGDQHGDLTW
jgi:tetratricopeptide (TPR) repeat protein